MRCAAALLLAVFLAAPVFATQPNPSSRQKELIDQIVVLTHLDDNVRTLLDAMLERMQKQMEGRSEEDKKDFARYRQLVREKIDFREWVRGVYEPLYAKYFTEQQLADLVAFYKTPTGQSLVKSLPEIEREAMQTAGDQIQEKFAALLQQVQDERKKRRPWEQTMTDMRSLMTAIEAWSTDNDEKYPAAMTLDELAKELEPAYMKAIPRKDAWGNDFAYVVSEDRKHFRIVSAGADNAFEWDSRRIVPTTPSKDAGEQVKLTDRLEDDIIMGDGGYIQVPRASQN
jgi:hypothetical protein